jgi:hypothetical protein
VVMYRLSFGDTGRSGGHRTTKAHIRNRPVADHGGDFLIRRKRQEIRQTRGGPCHHLRIISERPYPHKGSGTYLNSPTEVRCQRGATAPATFAFHSMGGEYLTPLMRLSYGNPTRETSPHMAPPVAFVASVPAAAI